MTNLGWAIIGWAMLALGAAWVVSCLIRWPTRAARCPKCRYDMSGVQPTADGFMCTECGRVTRQARRLHRRPRRKRLAMLALVLAIPASQMVMLSRRPDTQWTRWVPTSVLVLIAGKFDFGPCFDTPGPRAYMHLALVQRFERMWDWQRQLWLPREVVAQIREAEKAYVVREVWPEGEGVIVHRRPVERLPRPWGRSVTAVLTLVSVDGTPTLYPSLLKGAGAFGATGSFPYTAGSLGPVEFRVQVDLFWRYALALPGGDPFLDVLEKAEIVQSSVSGQPTAVGRTFSVSARVAAPPHRSVPTLDEAIEPVRDDASLNNALRDAISFRVVPDPRDWPNATPALTLPDESSLASATWPPDVGLRVRYRLVGPETNVELVEVRGSGAGAFRGYAPLFRTEGPGTAFRAAHLSFASGDDSAWEGWTLIVEGDGRAVLRETLAPKYWAGPLEIPFRPMR